jgi:hypothetical protein
MDYSIEEMLKQMFIGGAKALFLGPVGWHIGIVLVVGITSAYIEKRLIKRRKELMAQGVKAVSYWICAITALLAVLKAAKLTLITFRML